MDDVEVGEGGVRGVGGRAREGADGPVCGDAGHGGEGEGQLWDEGPGGGEGEGVCGDGLGRGAAAAGEGGEEGGGASGGRAEDVVVGRGALDVVEQGGRAGAGECAVDFDGGREGWEGEEG